MAMEEYLDILPLNIIDFSGENRGATNELYCTAENETDVKTYMIERSTDALNFINVGMLFGKEFAGFKIQISR